MGQIKAVSIAPCRVPVNAPQSDFSPHVQAVCRMSTRAYVCDQSSWGTSTRSPAWGGSVKRSLRSLAMAEGRCARPSPRPCRPWRCHPTPQNVVAHGPIGDAGVAERRRCVARTLPVSTLLFDGAKPWPCRPHGPTVSCGQRHSRVFPMRIRGRSDMSPEDSPRQPPAGGPASPAPSPAAGLVHCPRCGGTRIRGRTGPLILNVIACVVFLLLTPHALRNTPGIAPVTLGAASHDLYRPRRTPSLPRLPLPVRPRFRAFFRHDVTAISVAIPYP